VFSVLGVFSVLCFAVVACVGLDCELPVFPCFGGFRGFLFLQFGHLANNLIEENKHLDFTTGEEFMRDVAR
jgi:hypothetical protein